MKIDHITAMFFSATGTTSKICRCIAQRIADSIDAEYEEYGFTKPGRRIEAPSFGPEDLIVFGTPVYAGRVPNVLIKFIEKVRFERSLVVPVVLYGNRNYDDALKELSDTLKQDGAAIIGAGAFIGEHAFSYELAKGRPDDKDMEIAEGFAERIASKLIDHGISGGRPSGEAPAENVLNAIDISAAIPGEDPIRPYYKPRDSKGNFIDIRKVVPVTNSNCDGCGICVEVCPMGSIDPMHVTRLTGICIKCGACVKRCPRGAKYFDDPGFIYHKEELEKMYSARREPETFL